MLCAAVVGWLSCCSSPGDEVLADAPLQAVSAAEAAWEQFAGDFVAECVPREGSIWGTSSGWGRVVSRKRTARCDGSHPSERPGGFLAQVVELPWWSTFCKDNVGNFTCKCALHPDIERVGAGGGLRLQTEEFLKRYGVSFSGSNPNQKGRHS
jgi:hypothetical protein